MCLNCRSILSDDRVSWIRPCITCIVQITLIRYIAQDNATRRLYQGSFNLCYWCNFNEAQNKIISASKLSSCKLKVKHPSLHNVYSCWVCKFAGALYERGTLVLQSLSSAYKYLLLNIRGSSKCTCHFSPWLYCLNSPYFVKIMFCNFVKVKLNLLILFFQDEQVHEVKFWLIKIFI